MFAQGESHPQKVLPVFDEFEFLLSLQRKMA